MPKILDALEGEIRFHRQRADALEASLRTLMDAADALLEAIYRAEKEAAQPVPALVRRVAAAAEEFNKGKVAL